MDKPLILPIKKIVKENPTMNSYYFDYQLNSKPGQFLMVWIPGVDEKPFTVAYDNGQEFMLTIAKVGPATTELFKLKVGDKIGIRGPYGTSFRINEGQKIIMVGGGYGTAILRSVLDEALKKHCQVDFIQGARIKDLLILEEQIKSYSNVTYYVTTDDGSSGMKGLVTQILQQLLDSKKPDLILTCGPELMMKKISDMAYEKGVPAQLSLERYMKCGFGVCGNCAMDPMGWLVCTEGTVFSNTAVRQMTEFGKYWRDSEGRRREFTSKGEDKTYRT